MNWEDGRLAGDRRGTRRSLEYHYIKRSSEHQEIAGEGSLQTGRRRELRDQWIVDQGGLIPTGEGGQDSGEGGLIPAGEGGQDSVGSMEIA